MEMVAAECLHIVPLVIFSLSLLSTFPPVQVSYTHILLTCNEVAECFTKRNYHQYIEFSFVL